MRIETNELSAKLSLVSDVVQNSSHQAILNNVLIIVNPEETVVSFIGKDLDKYVRVEVVSEGNINGTMFLVPGQILFSVVARLKLTNDYLEFTSTGDNLIIQGEQDGSSVKINLQDASYYPEQLRFNPKKCLVVDKNELLRAISVSSFTQSPKLVLTKMHFTSDGSSLLVEATNGFVGGGIKIPATGDTFDIAVPGTADKSIRRLLQFLDEKVTLQVDKNYLFISVSGWTLAVLLYTEPYLDLSKLYGTSESAQAILLNKERLSADLQLLATVGSTTKVQLHFSPGLLTLVNQSELGKVERQVAVDWKSGNMKVVLDPVQFQKVVQLLENNFIMYIVSSTDRILIKDAVGTYFMIPFNL